MRAQTIGDDGLSRGHAGKPELSELDYLLHSADDRAGALGFGLNQEPPAPRRKFNQTIALVKLQEIADAIVADEELLSDGPHAQVEELLLVGTSMGGARPKTVVEDADGLWLARFNRHDDRWNSARRARHALAGMPELDYPLHDRDVVVTCCGRICMHKKKINISRVLAGQRLGIKEVDDGISLVRSILRGTCHPFTVSFSGCTTVLLPICPG
jgi:serine/threonine-protein kinase HipA